MTKKQEIQLFEEKKVRTVWDSEQEKWYFPIVDIVAVLTDSIDSQGFFRLIQSIPSPKAEPFKIRMAQGRQRCESCTKTIGEQNREIGHFDIQGKRLSVADGGCGRIECYLHGIAE